MLYLDSCIPMYLVGASHPHKKRILSLLPNLVAGGEPFFSSAETFQEIIHRYRALKDEKHMEAAYSALQQMVQQTESVKKQDVDLAKALTMQFRKLSSRDCLHAAVMKRTGCDRIWTYDSGFDEIPWLVRVF